MTGAYNNIDNSDVRGDAAIRQTKLSGLVISDSEIVSTGLTEKSISTAARIPKSKLGDLNIGDADIALTKLSGASIAPGVLTSVHVASLSVAKLLPGSTNQILASTSTGSAWTSDPILNSVTATSGRIGNAGAVTTSPNIVVAGSANGNDLEFGHPNSGGYRSVLGHEASSGAPNLVFSGEGGTTINTYRTRGIRSSIIKSDTSGGLLFGNVANANADNQTFVQTASLTAAGVFTPASPLPANACPGVWVGVYQTVSNNFSTAAAHNTEQIFGWNQAFGSVGGVGTGGGSTTLMSDNTITWSSGDNSKLVANVTGQYRLEYLVRNTTITAAGGTIAIYLRKNGNTTISYGATVTVGGLNGSSFCTDAAGSFKLGEITGAAPIVKLNAGDYVQLVFYCGLSDAATFNTVVLPVYPGSGAGYGWMRMEYVGT
jgi:hypothetical protein